MEKRAFAGLSDVGVCWLARNVAVTETTRFAYRWPSSLVPKPAYVTPLKSHAHRRRRAAMQTKRESQPPPRGLGSPVLPPTDEQTGVFPCCGRNSTMERAVCQGRLDHGVHQTARPAKEALVVAVSTLRHLRHDDGRWYSFFHHSSRKACLTLESSPHDLGQLDSV